MPPEKAFNGTRLRSFGFDDWLKTKGELPETGGKIRQRGFGDYTLCGPCNTNTGAWYGAEYVKWAVALAERLDQIPRPKRKVTIRVSNRFPLRFLKQACTMFFSANPPGSFPARYSDLVRFVLNKQSREFPRDIDLCISLYRGPLARIIGVAGRLEVATGSTDLISEIAFPPFALLLIANSGPSGRLGSISHFSNYGFGDRADLSLAVEVGAGNTPYPGDYRSRERVLTDAEGPWT